MHRYLIVTHSVFSLAVTGLAGAAPESQSQEDAQVEKTSEVPASEQRAKENRDQNQVSKEKDKRFVPRERISADAPISFPADI